MTLQIFLVEDHPVVLSALALLLNRELDLNVCASTTSGEEAFILLPHYQPDLVLVDLSMPRMNGLRLIAQLQQTQPTLPIIIVSAHDPSVYVASALYPNVKGYIQKQNAHQLLVPMIRAVLPSATFIY